MNIPRLPVWQQWLLHAASLWLLLTVSDAASYWYRLHMGFPYSVQANGEPLSQWQRFWQHNYEQAVGALVLAGTGVVEMAYHFVFCRRRVRYFLATLLLAGVGWVWFAQWFNYWKTGVPLRALPLEPALALAGYGLLYALGRDWLRRRWRAAEQQQQQGQAERALLRAQLQPHFFFNALNTLYGTALREHADQTAQSIEQLAGIMRYSLREAQQEFIALTDEFRFLTDYLHLQQLRLPTGGTVQVHTHLHHDGQPAQIAPLLLLTFLENAFHYGVSTELPCQLSVWLVVENQQLELRVRNDLLPSRATPPGAGTGLRNVRRRLQLLYPERHQLLIEQRAGRYQVQLHLQLQAP